MYNVTLCRLHRHIKNIKDELDVSQTMSMLVEPFNYFLLVCWKLLMYLHKILDVHQYGVRNLFVFLLAHRLLKIMEINHTLL